MKTVQGWFNKSGHIHLWNIIATKKKALEGCPWSIYGEKQIQMNLLAHNVSIILLTPGGMCLYVGPEKG